MLLLAHLQTVKGEDARDITAAEFAERVLPLVRKAVVEQKFKQRMSFVTDWQYSFDNATAHERWEEVITESQRFYLPACSPDMHKAVEHLHAQMELKMQIWMRQLGHKASLAECQQQLEHIFFNEIKAESIRGDVRSLVDTYKAIVAAGGAYPPKQYR